MNQVAGEEPARVHETAMSLQEVSVESEESKIAARDKRAADVFWWTLMAMRAVIPLYVFYAIYLYWTLPIAVRYSGGGY